MTEEDWLAEPDPVALLARTRHGTFSERKLRLFACAACRLFIWRWIKDKCCKEAVLASWAYADGLVSLDEMALHSKAASGAANRRNGGCKDEKEIRYWAAAKAVANAACLCQERDEWDGCPYQSNAWDCAWSIQRIGVRDKRVLGLLRHIIGNPFQSFPTPDQWPSTVVQLAGALYNGQDCGFALHDALLDAGHAVLAQHFRDEQDHPKGCWAVDLLLGKE